jgi:hypothetical protein
MIYAQVCQSAQAAHFVLGRPIPVAKHLKPKDTDGSEKAASAAQVWASVLKA